MLKRFVWIVLPLLIAIFLWVSNFHASSQSTPTASLGGAYHLWAEPEANRTPFLKAIANAQQEIDVVMYLFTDQKIANALTQAAQRGVKVRVLVEKAPYRSEKANAWLNAYWQDQAIELHWVPSHDSEINFYHEKAMIIDRKVLWIMTMNFVKSSFYQRNPERNFVLEDLEAIDVQQALAIFEKDWNDTNIQSLALDHLVVSPVNTRQALLNLIHQAKKHIEVYAEGLSDYALLRALENAADQGVQVQILYSENLRPKVMQYLKRYPIQLKQAVSFKNHAKAMIIDDQKFYLGSANFTKNSLDANRELGIVANDTTISGQLHNYFMQDWQMAG